MERQLTCIVCPRGCSLKVTLDGDGKPLKVEGNACPRGETYAIAECTAPMRTVTSTVKCEDGTVIPVKTDRTIPKGLVFEAMRVINATVAPSEAKVGDVLVEGILGTEANVVVTGKKP